MNINPIAIIVTIITGLLGAGIIAWIKKPRLVVLVPRFFSYSQITEQGQLVEITVLNQGFKTEENIEITLNSRLHYEVLGSSNQDISLVKNKILISRIGSASEVTVLLIVEKGLFKASDDIIECLSKETKGIVVSTLAEIPVTGATRIGLTAFFCVTFCIILYLSYEPLFGKKGFVSEVFPSELSMEEKKEQASKLNGWNIADYYTKSKLYDALENEKLSVLIGEAAIKNDNVTIPITLQNLYSEPVSFRINMTTSASESTIPAYKRTIRVFLVPGTSDKQEITVQIPEKSTSQIDRTVFIDSFLEARSGATLSMTRDNVIPVK